MLCLSEPWDFISTFNIIIICHFILRQVINVTNSQMIQLPLRETNSKMKAVDEKEKKKRYKQPFL